MPHTKHIGTFSARDKDGTRYTIYVYQDFIQTRRGEPAIPGLKELRLADGTHVNHIEQGQYEILNWRKTILTSDDPNAP